MHVAWWIWMASAAMHMLVCRMCSATRARARAVESSRDRQTTSCAKTQGFRRLALGPSFSRMKKICVHMIQPVQKTENRSSSELNTKNTTNVYWPDMHQGCHMREPLRLTASHAVQASCPIAAQWYTRRIRAQGAIRGSLIDARPSHHGHQNQHGRCGMIVSDARLLR